MHRSANAALPPRFVAFLTIYLVGTLLYFAQDVFMPLALAMLLAFLLSPLASQIERVGVGRLVSVLISVSLAMALLGGIGWVLENQLIATANRLPEYQQQIREKVDRFRHPHGYFSDATRHVQETISAMDASSGTRATTAPAADQAPASQGRSRVGGVDQVATAEHPLPVRIYSGEGSVGQKVLSYFTMSLSPLATIGLVLIFVIFMLLAKEDLRDRAIRLAGSNNLQLTTQTLEESALRISKYLRALAIVNAGYALATCLGLWCIGRYLGAGHAFPSILACGLLVGALRFVPYIGIWIGASFPLLLSFALLPGNVPFLATLALFVGLEVVVSQFIEPFWYGSSTGMSALAVLVSAAFWTWMWGAPGLLLSTPLTVLLVVMGRSVPALRFLHILLTDEEVLDLPTRFYQRLLALDREEADELALGYFKEHDIESTYDEILLPALVHGEQDRHRGELEPDRLKFLRDSISEIAEELAESDLHPAGLPSMGAALCLPAHDQADLVATRMVGFLLKRIGYEPQVLSDIALVSEMAKAAATGEHRLLCISATPPSAAAHARYLCKRLGSASKTLSFVGLWGGGRATEEARSRLACDPNVKVFTTFREMLSYLRHHAGEPHVAGNHLAASV